MSARNRKFTREINKLAKEGLAIVMVSSELPEVLGFVRQNSGFARRTFDGRIYKEEATPEKVMVAGDRRIKGDGLGICDFRFAVCD